MSRSIICDRADIFTQRIFNLCERWSKGGIAARHVASELIRCGPSIGANANEAQEAQTKRDFIAKMSVARKESRETLYWLRNALAAGIVPAHEFEWELNEAGELRAMIIAAIKTAQSNPDRRRRPDPPQPDADDGSP